MSQTDAILTALKAGDKITPIDALNRFACLRLSGRILEIREMGYGVITRMVDVPSGKRVAEYSLDCGLPNHG